MRSAAVLLALCSLDLSAASPWIRVASPSAEIFTDSSEKSARAVLNRFESLHDIFRETHIVESDSSVRVFLFSSRREFEEYRSDPNVAAFYSGGGDRDVIVLEEAAALERFATHEYLHRVIAHASPLLPHWLDEGLPDFYSTLSLSKSKMRIGDPIAPYLLRLTDQPWMSAEDLARGTPSDRPLFYAQSWALVHMLSLSPQWSKGMPRFVDLLTQGGNPEEAFHTAFGASMKQALETLTIYLKNPRELTTPVPSFAASGKYSVTTMEPGEITPLLADLALRTGHGDLARTLFLTAARENPQSPSAIAGLATLALSENRKEDARREWEHAIALGSRDAGVYFQLADLTNNNAFLEKALTIDPQLAEAHFLLGVRATDRGDSVSAIAHLRQATSLEPRRLTYWHALGYAQAKSGDRLGAAETARRVLLLASNGQEEEMAAALIQLAAEQSPLPTVKKPEVVTPASWQNRKGDARIEGTLTEVNCTADPVRLVVSNPDATLALDVRNPGEVELVNADGASTILVCGAQSQPVLVEYLAATREITRIEFKHVVIMKR
jgi:Flp pilus assembly protein TadD